MNTTTTATNEVRGALALLRLNDVVDHTRVDRSPAGGDLDRGRAVGQGAGEETRRRTGIAALRNKDVDDLPVLIDRAVEVGPAAGDLDVGLIDERSIRSCGVPGVPRR
jgi:hypothetical protein